MHEQATLDRRLGNPLPERVAVFRALMLGDMLCAIPALRALRHALPEATIVLIGLSWSREIVARFDRYLDGFLEFPGYPGLPERPVELRQIPAFLEHVQASRFDLVLQMHGSGATSNSLAALLGAKQTAGFYVAGEYCPDPERFLPYPTEEPEVRRHLRLMEFLGIPPQGEELEFPIRREDRSVLEAIAKPAGLQPGQYVCIHPGARHWSRRWKPERFAQVGDALVRDGFQVVITGSRDEARLAETVSRMMSRPHVNLVGRTNLGALAALMENARLLISNDTGVSHLAAALAVPSVVLVLSTDWSRWAPLDRQRHQAVMHPVDCRPCGYSVCPVGFPCADGLTVDAVLDRVNEVLSCQGVSH